MGSDLHHRGILASHTDNRFCIGSYEKNSRRLTNSFKLIKGIQLLAEFFTVVAGEGDAPDILFTQSVINSLHAGFKCLFNFAEMARVVGFIDNLLNIIYN